MKLSTLIALLGLAVFAFACSTPERYPVTGEECSAADPVKDLPDPQCMPAM